MLPLLSIRIKYLIRNPCLLFWTYLFIPGVIFLLVLSVMSGNSKDDYNLKLKDNPIKSGENYFFNEIDDNNNIIKRNYDSLRYFLNTSSILVNNQKY